MDHPIISELCAVMSVEACEMTNPIGSEGPRFYRPKATNGCEALRPPEASGNIKLGVS